MAHHTTKPDHQKIYTIKNFFKCKGIKLDIMN